MAHNYALEILQDKLAELREQIAGLKDAINKLSEVPEFNPTIDRVNFSERTDKFDPKIHRINLDEVKEVKPVKNPAAFHVTKLLANWLDKQPSPLSIDAFRETFPSYKEATLKTQLYNYKRNTGRK